jgi:hypothetical protein
MPASEANAQRDAQRASRRPSCPAAGHALVADAQAEVYEAEGRFAREVFACAYATHHVSDLGAAPGEASPEGAAGVQIETIALSGSIAGYERFSSGPYGNSSWIIIVQDLRTGHVLHRVNAVGGFTEQIIVKNDGSAAWITDTRYGPSEYAVVALGKAGAPRVLAQGPDIAPTSLALGGNTLYWTKGKQAYSTLLQ